MAADMDLGAVFDEHVSNEFEAKDIEATMATMADSPYVWHVPVLTGAEGRQEVRAFYSTSFIGHTPEDAVIHRIARTVAEDRVIDELVLEFTHEDELPFMAPGVARTGRKVKLAHVVVMDFEDGKVAAERIYWDQASLLSQLGVLDAEGLPVVGVEQAEELIRLTGAET